MFYHIKKTLVYSYQSFSFPIVKLMLRFWLPELSDFTRVLSLVKVLFNIKRAHDSLFQLDLHQHFSEVNQHFSCITSLHLHVILFMDCHCIFVIYFSVCLILIYLVWFANDFSFLIYTCMRRHWCRFANSFFCLGVCPIQWMEHPPDE